MERACSQDLLWPKSEGGTSLLECSRSLVGQRFAFPSHLTSGVHGEGTAA